MTTTQRFLGAMMALMIAASASAQSPPSPTGAATIVLVHGAPIDGSSWRGVCDVLTKVCAQRVWQRSWSQAQRRAVASGPSNELLGRRMV
jgi:pimeloyl-ACP methyl ester carboxylesterase